jgi:hypothetical protein
LGALLVAQENSITIQKALALHFSESSFELSLPQSFCDGIFLKTSSLALRIRKKVFKLGFQFSMLEGGLIKDNYYQNSWLSFIQARKEKRIFYVNTVWPIEFIIENEAKAIQDLDVQLFAVTKLNNQQKIFRESVANILLELFFEDGEALFQPPQNNQIQKSKLSRHLAVCAGILTMELMAGIVKPTFENQFIGLSQLRNAPQYPDDFILFKNLFAKFGLEKTFQFLFRGYLKAVSRPYLNQNTDSKELTPENLEEDVDLKKIFEQTENVFKGDEVYSNFISSYLMSFGYEVNEEGKIENDHELTSVLQLSHYEKLILRLMVDEVQL